MIFLHNVGVIFEELREAMKSFAKYLLHKLFGFKNYLFIFSIFKIYTLKWDKNEKDFFYFLKLLPEGGHVLDIGANIGIMTVYLSRKRDAHVWAFEPMPNNVQALKRIITFFALKNVKLLEYALGDKDGKIEMVMPVIDKVKMQGLSHVVHESIADNNEGEKFEVPIKKLDAMEEFQKDGINITGIKMDVENFEYFVLKGGEGLLRKHQPLLYCELWDNENRSACFELMQNLGYSINIVHGNHHHPFDPKQHQTQNFLFIPPKTKN